LILSGNFILKLAKAKSGDEFIGEVGKVIQSFAIQTEHGFASVELLSLA
jgi:hypothetical protein